MVNGGGHIRGHSGGGGNYKVINGVEITNPNILFKNKDWENMPVWVRREFQQINDRKCDKDKRIVETCKKKRENRSVGITADNQSVDAATISGFMNSRQSQNEGGSRKGIHT